MKKWSGEGQNQGQSQALCLLALGCSHTVLLSLAGFMQRLLMFLSSPSRCGSRTFYLVPQWVHPCPKLPDSGIQLGLAVFPVWNLRHHI
jgi:hypothetical protein